MGIEQINIIDLFKVVLKRWWTILILVIAFGIGSYVYSSVAMTPIYVATGSLFITVDNTAIEATTNNNVNYNDIMAAQALTNTYAQILKSNTFFKQISAESGLNYSYKSLNAMVSVTTSDESQIIKVSANCSSPDDAATIVETILNNSQDEIGRVIVGGIVKIVDHPEIPSRPAYPNVKRNVAIAILFATLIGIALNIVIELLDDSIKSASYVSTKYNLPVLAEIPNASLSELN